MKIAVITGASSGLGAEYCRLLQARGEYDEIWLIARRLERLQALKGDDARMRCLSLDLTDAAAFDTLCKELTEHDAEIALLINNAGLGTYGSLETLSAESQVRMTDLNVTALTRMTAVCLPFMKRGAEIINIASIASFAPNPGMTVYSSTKAYVLSFSCGLREELKARGIRVLAVCPGPMDTEFLDVAEIRGRSKMFDTLPYADPKKVAASSLKAARRGRAIYTPLFLFKLYRVLAKILPVTLMIKFTKT